jgi:uncharacterized protein (DUF2384 family)
MLRRLWKLVAFVAVAAGYTLYAGAAVRSTSSRRERAQAMARRQQRGARRLLRILGVRVTVNGPDPEAIAVDDFPVEHVRQRRQIDVWMGPYVDPLARDDFGGTHVVEEDERTDHLSLRRW